MPEDKKSSRGFGRYRLFTLFGFEIKLDLSWLLLALLISWSLGAGVFPAEYPDLPRPVYAWMGVACAIGVFFSIVFHEFSHSIVARHFGMPIKGITLFIFGGVAEMEREPPSPKSEFLMAVAGPIASFVLALIFWRFEILAVARNWPLSVVGVSDTLAYINVAVAIFNLVPAFPLDGGRMLRAALWHWKDDMRAATYISSRMGRGFGLVLIVFGIIAVIQGNFIGGMWWFLIGMFLRGAAAASYQQLMLQEVLKDKPVRNFMKTDVITVPPSTSLTDWIEDYVYQHQFKLFPVVDDGQLVGAISINDAKRTPRESWRATKVRDLMQAVSPANSVAADTETTKVLATLLRPDTPSRFMVVEGGQLVGMISVKDLLELIALKLEIESASR